MFQGWRYGLQNRMARFDSGGLCSNNWKRDNMGYNIERRLFVLCHNFIYDNEITCGETVYQTDRVSENSLECIAEICEIVGYHKHKDEDD